MACSDAIKILADLKIKTEGSLHMKRLRLGDGQAKRSRDPVDDALEWMDIIDWGVEDGTNERMSLRLAIGDVNIVNAVLLKEVEDVLGGVESGVAVCTVVTHTNPNGDTTGDRLAVTVLSLLLPTEANEVDGGVLDLLIVEDFDRLGTDVSPKIAMLREGHEPHHESLPIGSPGRVWHACGR
jgi:hypothetical protein